jgi:hypothetical protein
MRRCHQQCGMIEGRNALRSQAFIIGRFGTAQVKEKGFGDRRSNRRFPA